MTNSLKNHLFDLLDQEKLDEVMSQLNIYFKDKHQIPANYKRLFLSLEEGFKTLNESKNNGIVSEADFEIKAVEIRRELKELIQEIVGYFKKKKKQSRPKVRSENRKSPSSIFDKIIGSIKSIPSSVFPSRNKSKALPHNEDDFYGKKEDYLLPPIVEEPKDSPVYERMNEPEPSETELPNEEIILPSPSVPQAPKNPKSPPPSPAAVRNPTQIGSTQSPFQQGKILYAIPDNMCIGKEICCKVRIAPDQFSIEEMTTGLSDREKTAAKNESIKITSIMKVVLEENGDAHNFDINNRSTTEQPILPFGFTEWAFDVTAKRPGHHALLLRVSAKINIPGFGERPFDVAVLDRAILVSTTVTGQDDPEIIFSEQSVPDPEWNEEDEQMVLVALEKGRIDQAIERIANFVQDKDRDFHTELILLHARWNDNTNQLQEKRISASDWDIVNNKVRFAITQLLGQLKVSFSPGSTDSAVDWKKEKEKLR